MLSGKSKPQAKRTVPTGKGLVRITKAEATQTVGGCGRQALLPPASAIVDAVR